MKIKEILIGSLIAFFLVVCLNLYKYFETPEYHNRNSPISLPVEKPKPKPKVKSRPVAKTKAQEYKDLSSKRSDWITGKNITYLVPSDMKRIKVRIKESNGKLVNEYTLTKYITIKPKHRVQLIVE